MDLTSYVSNLGRVVAEGTAEELRRRIPGGHVRLRFADLQGLDTAIRVLGQASREADALALRVPNGAAGGRAAYVNYVAPAIILMTVAATVQGTAISVAMDMTEGMRGGSVG